MRAIQCRLLYRSISPHLQQLYTGFLMLHGSGFIHLSQHLHRAPWEYPGDVPHLKDACHAHLDVVLEGNLRLHFDTHDSADIAMSELQACDFYFKRSFSPATIAKLTESEQQKIMPLGLSYRVLPDVVDFFALRRSLRLNGIFRNSYSAVRQALDIGNKLGHQPRLAQMHAPVNFDASPTVMFLVAAYDPYDDPERTPDKVLERILINETRARIISLLIEALGTRFVGGFSESEYSCEHYRDLVVPAEVTTQESYLQRLKSTPICIATTGLHGSVGWKLAEYVAFARAPLAQKLTYTVPGSFAAGANYLEFDLPSECMTAAVRLIEDAQLRQELMRNNASYYQNHLRPDALVKNALTAALARKSRSH